MSSINGMTPVTTPQSPQTGVSTTTTTSGGGTTPQFEAQLNQVNADYAKYSATYTNFNSVSQTIEQDDPSSAAYQQAVQQAHSDTAQMVQQGYQWHQDAMQLVNEATTSDEHQAATAALAPALGEGTTSFTQLNTNVQGANDDGFGDVTKLADQELQYANDVRNALGQPTTSFAGNVTYLDPTPGLSPSAS